MHSEGQNRPGESGLPDANDPTHSGAELRSGTELRGSPRFTLLLRVAKLVVDDREQICVIRDASATGLKVKIFAPLPQHAELAVELANGDTITAALLVGADGGQSWVRSQCDIGFDYCSYGQRGVVSNFACTMPHRGVAPITKEA